MNMNQQKPMYKILEREGRKANRNHFGFDEVCLNEPAQFTEYDGSKGGHYGWHMDSEISMKNQPPVRKNISDNFIIGSKRF